MYDHFHAVYYQGDQRVEIQGGLSPKLEKSEWDALRAMPWPEFVNWAAPIARDWGMPADAELASFWAAR